VVPKGAACPRSWAIAQGSNAADKTLNRNKAQRPSTWPAPDGRTVPGSPRRRKSSSKANSRTGSLTQRGGACSRGASLFGNRRRTAAVSFTDRTVAAARSGVSMRVPR
jgi:hypothetical protein